MATDLLYFVCVCYWQLADEEDSTESQQAEEIIETMANQGEITQCKLIQYYY